MTEERWDIPAGWSWTSMGDVADIVGGGTPSTSDDSNFAENGIAWLTPADLTGYRDTYIARGRRDLSERGYQTSAARIIPAGTVLFSSRAPIGYCAIAEVEISTNQGFKSFVLNGDLSPEYLRHYLLSSVEYVESKASGTTFKELSGSRAAELAVPIPPIPEQRRVVAKIDSLTGKSRRARNQLDHVPRLVEKYKQAVLAAALSGKFSPDLDASLFDPVPLETVTASTFYGPRIGQEAYVKAGIPTLRTTDIADWGRVEPQAPPQVKVSQADFSKWGLQHGDLMVTRTGATIGKCAVYDDAMGPALPSAYLIRVRLKLNEVDPRFAVLFLLSPSGQRQLLDGRTAVAQPNINAHAITSVRLPLPPIAYQRKIAERVEGMFSDIDRLASEATSARKLIDRLDQAVLAKAFRGKLVPQDPADEPASALLERIKSGRADAPKQKRRSKG